MSKKSYEVGYKLPPKEHQWPPGQSGNPSGKKGKKAPSPPLLSLIADQLEQSVEITSGGKKLKVPLGQALSTKLVYEAMGAPFKEKVAFLCQLAKLGVLDLQKQLYEEESGEEDFLSEEDRRLLELARREIAADDEEGDAS